MIGTYYEEYTNISLRKQNPFTAPTFSSLISSSLNNTQSNPTGFTLLVAQMKAIVNTYNSSYSVCIGVIYYMFYDTQRLLHFSRKRILPF